MITPATLAAVLVLSLGIWTYFYMTPGAPLDASETAVVVGLCAGLVFSARWIWRRVRKTRRGHGQPS